MKKFSIIISRAFLATAFCSAFPFTVQADLLTGTTAWNPYVGAGIGYGGTDIRNNYYQNYMGTPAYSSQSSTARGPVESIYAGIQKRLECHMIGAEIYGALRQQKVKTSRFTEVADHHADIISNDYGYGVKLRGGYITNASSIVYLHAGIERAQFSYKGTTTLYVGSGGEQSFKTKKSLWGFPFGIGADIALDNKWTARLEYTYTHYETWRTKNLRTNNTVTAKLVPSQQAFTLGFSYKL